MEKHWEDEDAPFRDNHPVVQRAWSPIVCKALAAELSAMLKSFASMTMSK